MGDMSPTTSNNIFFNLTDEGPKSAVTQALNQGRSLKNKISEHLVHKKRNKVMT